MGGEWTDRLGEVELRIESRRLGDDGGPTLRVGPAGRGLEWLRFDCFDKNPHWHLDPTGRDEVQPLVGSPDPISEVFGMLRSDLPGLLERAGAPSTALASLRSTDLARRLLEAERRMRHRPACLDELDIHRLRQRRSAKWHLHPDDILPAWVAEMDFPVAASIQDELRRFVESSDLGYPLESEDTGLPRVFSERMQERFDWSPDPRRVELLSEVVQGLFIALEAFTEKGEGAIVQTPIYPPFLAAVAETGRRLVENRMIRGGERLEFDLDGLADRIDPGTRILLLCNPHNPSGRVMTQEELDRLAALVLEHDLLVVSDEIHADLVFEGRRHIPFASLGPEIARRTITLTSTSKAFNIPGLRCAIAHFGDARLQARFNQLHPVHTRGGIGLLGIYASIAAWRWGQPWLDEVVPYLQANRDFVRERLAERIPEIGFDAPESTYLAWLDCAALPIEGSPASFFLRNGGIALSGGRRFGGGGDQHVRLNFATSRPILSEAIDRMAKALGR
ncbi:MAG TPA: putative C-S lyase [Deltaproteobacteria bacterium]|nr:putative C-S lyase [Deltaproteobacteria bacterium]